jgi:hypothetical protein
VGTFTDELNRLDVADERAPSHLVQLLRKLRWLGMDEEAERVVAQLIGCCFQATEPVLAAPSPTD